MKCVIYAQMYDISLIYVINTAALKSRGKLIYHDEIKKYKNDGKFKSAEEMVVTHAEDRYHSKYYIKKGDVSIKIESNITNYWEGVHSIYYIK